MCIVRSHMFSNCMYCVCTYMRTSLWTVYVDACVLCVSWRKIFCHRGSSSCHLRSENFFRTSPPPPSTPPPTGRFDPMDPDSTFLSRNIMSRSTDRRGTNINELEPQRVSQMDTTLTYARRCLDRMSAECLLYAIAGACLIGTYPAPIKAQSVIDAKVHPAIFQIYKTGVVFVTSLFALIPRAIKGQSDFWPF